ncbi:MAG: c-type cytochrome [Pirellulales bacterium]|nr:c-type cytochrome [Pirellulales bacterium]
MALLADRVISADSPAEAPAAAAQAPADENPETRDYAAELPRIPPTPAAVALETFNTLPGFRMEQAAAEPLVRDPVALAFDGDGRLFVVEMCDYSEQDKDFLGNVRLLEDRDEDGRFETSTLFADKLSWPTAITCFDGGVFVGAAPDIWYLKDNDGDGRADARRRVFTGFGRDNVQGLLNSFHWGLDDRIHGATSSSGGAVVPCDENGEPRSGAAPVRLGGRDFAFNPRTLAIEATSGGAQHGMCFDDWGRKFVCSNSDHIQLVMFDERYVARNSYLAAPSARLSIAADGPQAEVYRLSPVEPWRIVRTRLRVAQKVPGPVEGGGRAAGYFTGATGVTIYRGAAWPEPFRGNAFVGDVGGNLVHRKLLADHGVEQIARRADEGVEFVASRDIWFRPAQFANAPDGTLYIADVYREVIEHPASLPPMIKKHLDLTSGRDRGRIYRVVPDGFEQPKLPKFSSASTADLVATLAHPNGWQRDSAARLLFERQDVAAVEPLRRLALEAALPQARMHAMYALAGQNALAAETLLLRLADEHPRVREHAVRLAEPLLAGSLELRWKLASLTADADARVRYQLALAAGYLPLPERLPVLLELARRDAADRWVRLALQSSLGEGAGAMLALVVGDETLRRSEGGRALAASLAEQVGRQHQAQELAALADSLTKLPADDRPLVAALLRGVAASLPNVGALRETFTTAGATQIDDVLNSLVEQARAVAADESRDPAQRAAAIADLTFGSFETVAPVVVALIDQRQPQAVQRAALAALARFDRPEVAARLVELWPTLLPALRGEASEVLFARVERIAAVFDAVNAGTLQASDFDPARLRLLANHADAAIRERAAKLLAAAPSTERAEIIAAYRPALELSGDIERGKVMFHKTCAACHKLEGLGHEIAPNLATIQNRGAEAILLNVLDPNREVNPQYVNYVLVTDDGRTITGMIAAETATSVTLRRAEDQSDTVLRSQIEALESTRQSLMPEGMEKQIDPQAMADLIAYLLSVK